MKLKVVKIKEEPTQNGTILLRIFVTSNGETYTFGARKADYLDDRKRESILQDEFKKIKAIQTEKNRNSKKYKADTKKLVQLASEEIEEDPYE